MKNLIYYPGFEVQDVNWLKFALLYVDVLNPIIPKTADRYVGELHRMLLAETDLISSHRPNEKEGFRATLDAIDEVEKILKNPSAYAPVFDDSGFVDSWAMPANHQYTLFNEKYTDSWQEFCVKNRLGTVTDEGLRVHKDLGYIYMSLLAHTIADSRGISPITDHAELDRFSIFTRARTDSADTRVAQAVIELELPINYREIALESFIELRNRPGFKERLAAFHQELDHYLDQAKDPVPGKFASSLSSGWREFSAPFFTAGLGGVGVGLGVWIAIESGSDAKVLKEIIGGALLVVGGVVAITNSWKNTKTQTYTKKYLSTLTKIQPSILAD